MKKARKTSLCVVLLSWVSSALFLLTGCVTQRNLAPADPDPLASATDLDTKQGTAGVSSSKTKAELPRTSTDIENLTIGEVIGLEEPNTATLYDNSRYDFPITMNARVEGWIDYFTGRGRPHMERYLSRSSRYIPLMKEVLKKNGLPEDLVYLALIESGFNLRAKSRARAVGAWQFMKATGKRYGLTVDAWVDERRDPIKSTEAAARYLKDLYLMFESWYLAASAYNAGEYKILRAIETVKTHNFWRISQTSAIRRETKDYIPKLIAAAIIAKNPARYEFKDLSYEEPLAFDSITVDFPIRLTEIANIIDVSEEDIAELNPHLIRGTVPPNSGEYEVRIPSGSKTLVERAVAALKGKGSALAAIPKQHLVKPGESLRTVASRYRIRLNELANANNLSTKEAVNPGTALIIPEKGSLTQNRVQSPTRTPTKLAYREQNAGSDSAEDSFVTHTVRSGESLWSISEKYSVTVQQIFKWNGLKKSRIFPGKKLRIKPSGGSIADESYYAPTPAHRRRRNG